MLRPLDVDEVLRDPSASFWLKGAIRSLQGRDPVDAANDAEVLAGLFKARLETTPGRP